MEQTQNKYRFNLKAWLMKLPVDKRSHAVKKIMTESKQGRHTIKRIMYMKPEDAGYVRPETKIAICKVFGKELNQLENPLNINQDGRKTGI